MAGGLLDHKVPLLERHRAFVDDQGQFAVDEEVEVDRPGRVEAVLVDARHLAVLHLRVGRERREHDPHPAGDLWPDPLGRRRRVDRLDPRPHVARLVVPDHLAGRRVELVDRDDVRPALLVDSGHDTFHLNLLSNASRSRRRRATRCPGRRPRRGVSGPSARRRVAPR